MASSHLSPDYTMVVIMIYNAYANVHIASGDTCSSIATAAGISLSSFYAWNPAVGTTCGSLWLGYEVCIGLIGSTPTTLTTATTTSAGNGITTPTPYQAGMASNCNAFHLGK